MTAADDRLDRQQVATAGTATSADGVSVRYDAAGEGPVALVFVHGWCCNRSHWRAQVRSFASGYRTIALDLGGHGQSGGGRQAWTARQAGRDVVAVVDHLDLRQIVLIGHSMGGYVIAFAAAQLLERAVGLVGVEAYRQLDRPVTAERIAPFRQDFRQAMGQTARRLFRPDADPDLVARVVEEMQAVAPETGIGFLEASLTEVEEAKDILRRFDSSVETPLSPETGRFPEIRVL